MATMKLKIFLGLLGALLVAAGCVNTVSGRKTGGVPFVKDTMAGRYPRPQEEVFNSAKSVVSRLGIVTSESTLYEQSNAVKIVEGKVNQRNVWIRIEAVEPKVTEVTVQTRTKGGATDIDLAHQIEKEIALGLVH